MYKTDVGGNNVHFFILITGAYNMTMDLRPISKILQEKCKKELNEQPERLVSDIMAMRHWLQKQPHLQSVKPCKCNSYE